MVLTVSSNFAMKCGNVWTIGLTVCLHFDLCHFYCSRVIRLYTGISCARDRAIY
jgi:hypothetical protein